MLVNYKADIIIISSNVTNYRHDIAETLLIWHWTTNWVWIGNSITGYFFFKKQWLVGSESV